METGSLTLSSATTHIFPLCPDLRRDLADSRLFLEIGRQPFLCLHCLISQITEGTADLDLVEVPQIPPQFAADHRHTIGGEADFFGKIEVVDRFDQSTTPI